MDIPGESEAFLERPHIRTFADLASLCDVNDLATGMFLRSTFAYIDKHDHAWSGQKNLQRMKLSTDDLNQELQLVPDEKVYPVATPDITVVEHTRQTYVKRPKLALLDVEEEAGMIPSLFRGEIEVLEVLKRYPHPNLIQYLGCTVRRSRVTGIVLERHDRILAYRFEETTRAFDNNAFMQQLELGVRHLHSTGHAHNDLNPYNIALDGSDRPVIIDFGSCRRFGADLTSAGTPGWAGEYITSEQVHDELAMERIRNWITGRMQNAFAVQS